jgi:hypothetical protein
MSSGCGLCIYSHAQVSQGKNITAINNTVYDNDSGLYYRWSGSNLVLANNAIYSLGKTAIDSNGTITSSGGVVVANFVEGGMSGDSLGGGRFSNGGTSASAFLNPSNKDFWPRSGSPLIGTANAGYAPPTDFNRATRGSPFDVGAYETTGQATNPGWKIVPGFKLVGSEMPPVAPSDLRVD